MGGDETGLGVTKKATVGWFVPRQDRLPLFLVGTIIAVAYAWNAFVGLTFQSSATGFSTIAGVLFCLTGYYWRFRPDECRVAEIPLYFALWFLFPMFGTRLTYLGIAAGAPVQDSLFIHADALLGLDWVAWNNLLEPYHGLNLVMALTYESSIIQPIFAIPILAISAPLGRNQQFLIAICTALILTILICSLLPAYGPQADFGINESLKNVVLDLRHGHHQPLYLSGIICFPSFHTAMAIIFTWIHRKVWSFWPFAALNAAMLLTIPTCGNHYFVDMFGGAAIALIGIFIATRSTGSEHAELNQLHRKIWGRRHRSALEFLC